MGDLANITNVSNLDNFDTTALGELTSKEVGELVDKAIKEKMLAKNSTEQKRQRFRDRQMLYNNPNSPVDKIRVNLIRGLINSKLALYYDDRLTVKWTSRGIFSFLEAENFQNLCEYDYDNLDMEVSDYLVQKNKEFYWIGIEIIESWDDESKNPTYRSINPMSMYPDPNGHSTINNFQFIGFESMIGVDEIKNNSDFVNTEVVVGWMSPDMQVNTQAMKYPRELSNGYNYTDWNSTTIYTHYTTYKNKSYQLVLRRDKVPLSIKAVAPLNEKGCLIKFPVALYYMEPDPSDPRGINMFDVAEDKQRLKSLIMNLIRIQAIKQAMGWKRFLDKAIYTKSKNILTTWAVGPQYIPVENGMGWPLRDMIHKEPVDQLSPDVYQFNNMLDNQARSEANLDQQTWGVANPNINTATESDIVQMNSNINAVLGTKINARWVKTKFQIRYYFYKYYFSDTDEKFVELNRWITQAGDLFTRKDIISWTDPRIRIERKWLLEKQNAEVASKFLEFYPLFMADPSNSLVAKRFMKRKALKLMGLTLREIEEWCPREPEELDAKEQCILLSNNLPVEIGDMSEDHYAHLIIYQSALLTPATKSAIAMRKQAYIRSGQQAKMQQAQMQAMAQMPGAMQWVMANKPRPGIPQQ